MSTKATKCLLCSQDYFDMITTCTCGHAICKDCLEPEEGFRMLRKPIWFCPLCHSQTPAQWDLTSTEPSTPIYIDSGRTLFHLEERNADGKLVEIVAKRCSTCETPLEHDTMHICTTCDGYYCFSPQCLDTHIRDNPTHVSRNFKEECRNGIQTIRELTDLVSDNGRTIQNRKEELAGIVDYAEKEYMGLYDSMRKQITFFQEQLQAALDKSKEMLSEIGKKMEIYHNDILTDIKMDVERMAYWEELTNRLTNRLSGLKKEIDDMPEPYLTPDALCEINKMKKVLKPIILGTDNLLCDKTKRQLSFNAARRHMGFQMEPTHRIQISDRHFLSINLHFRSIEDLIWKTTTPSEPDVNWSDESRVLSSYEYSPRDDIIPLLTELDGPDASEDIPHNMKLRSFCYVDDNLYCLNTGKRAIYQLRVSKSSNMRITGIVKRYVFPPKTITNKSWLKWFRNSTGRAILVVLSTDTSTVFTFDSSLNRLQTFSGILEASCVTSGTHGELYLASTSRNKNSILHYNLVAPLDEGQQGMLFREKPEEIIFKHTTGITSMAFTKERNIAVLSPSWGRGSFPLFDLKGVHLQDILIPPVKDERLLSPNHFLRTPGGDLCLIAKGTCVLHAFIWTTSDYTQPITIKLAHNQSKEIQDTFFISRTDLLVNYTDGTIHVFSISN